MTHTRNPRAQTKPTATATNTANRRESKPKEASKPKDALQTARNSKRSRDDTADTELESAEVPNSQHRRKRGQIRIQPLHLHLLLDDLRVPRQKHKVHRREGNNE